MSESGFKLARAPIVEAVLDIDCDLPIGQELVALEAAARDAFRNHYPKFEPQLIQQHKIETKPDTAPSLSVRSEIGSLRFFQSDEKQAIQIRVQGYSFNRLSSYGSLDDYLPEIERTWQLYVGLVSPVQVRTIRLRYINRILLPLEGGRVTLDKYLKVGPHLPDEAQLTMVGFLNQHAAVEIGTGHQVNIVLMGEPTFEDQLPIILDIGVVAGEPLNPADWEPILAKVQALRSLKNRIFRNTLTQACLNLFQ